MKKICILLAAGMWLVVRVAGAQDSLSLQDCFRLADEHYPLAGQQDDWKQIGELQADETGAAFLPQLGLDAQATHQSDVPQFPLDLPGVPQISRTQYKAVLEVSQLLYDGGQVSGQKKVQSLQALGEAGKIAISRHQFRVRITDIYLKILLLRQNLLLDSSMLQEISRALAQMRTALANGIAAADNVDQLEAERLQISQQIAGIQADHEGALRSLETFIGENISDSVRLLVPSPPSSSLQGFALRPEFQLHEVQDSLLRSQSLLLKATHRPQLRAFVQGGYGEPGLNFLSDKAEGYYIAGIRLNWNIAQLYTAKKQQQEIHLQQLLNEKQQDIFLTDALAEEKENQAAKEKMQDMLAKDEQLIALRGHIRERASLKLQQGIVTAKEFLDELTAEQQARLQYALHSLSLLQVQLHEQLNHGIL